MNETREEMLAHSCGEDFVCRHFPPQHWQKSGAPFYWSGLTQKQSAASASSASSPNDAAFTRLVGAVLTEQLEHWQLEGRRMFPAESIAAIPELEDLPAQLSAAA